MNDLKKLILYLLILILIPISVRVYQLSSDENYYGFPAVTKCRICNKTIWEWQNYERRDFGVYSNYPYISMSGLVHCECEGTPKDTIIIKIH